ncbi:MAG: polysaccharide pyruvyl transferase family protein [Eubacterium sp.]|nr:polysaccharide pyruvyl transferase family protein [Eubacterium sp.]
MKIGLLTFTDGTNYGQRLQNYALQEAIRREGHEVFTIKQKHIYSKKHMIKEAVNGMVNRKKKLAEQARINSFERFNNRYISFYEKEIEENSEYSVELNNYFDLFIAGSDQIWNPNSPFVNSNFFMEFADKHKRASYAPSFSVDIIPESSCKSFASWLKAIPALSIRELRGANIIKALTGRDAKLVLDPTLLLTAEEWNAVCKKTASSVSNSPYVLTLFLGEEYENEIKYIQEKTKLPVLTLKDIYSFSPDEFLQCVKEAKLVLTDSYHVTVFSMIFSKPFIVFDRRSKGSGMSSRFETLDYYFDIKNRFWNNIKDDTCSWLKNDGISYSSKIEGLREESLRYLLSILNFSL